MPRGAQEIGLRHLLGVAAVAGHFLFFAVESLRSHFAPDEMMNMGWAWQAGPGQILRQIAAFWQMSYRPVGALYYWALHRLFHLNPVPFRVFDLALLMFNVWLAYQLARVLGLRRPAAWLVAFLFSYHERISIWVAYNGAWTYDRLCFTFTVGLLVLYARWREGGAGQRALLALVFLLALGAKEMAVVAPLLLIAYEAIYFGAVPRASRWGLAFLALLCVVSLAYTRGRTQGPEALANMPRYGLRPATVENYLEAQGRHIHDYFFQTRARPVGTAAAILAAMAMAAAVARRRGLAFALVFVLVAPLPIAFTDRGGGALYIPYLGWCLFAAAALEGLVATVKRDWVFWPVAAMLAVWLVTNNYRGWVSEKPAMLTNGDVTWRVISDLNRLRPAIKPDARIYVEKNPMEGWDIWFILALWADVKPVEIMIAGKNAPLGLAAPGLTAIFSLDEGGHLQYREPSR